MVSVRSPVQGGDSLEGCYSALTLTLTPEGDGLNSNPQFPIISSPWKPVGILVAIRAVRAGHQEQGSHYC